MTTRSGGPTATKGIPPAAIGAAVVVLVLFVGWIAYSSLFPHVQITDRPQPPTQVESWIQQKARESGGDINKLSPPDRQRLMIETRGEGARMLQQYAHPQ